MIYSDSFGQLLLEHQVHWRWLWRRRWVGGRRRRMAVIVLKLQIQVVP